MRVGAFVETMSTYIFTLDDAARNYARQFLNEIDENRNSSIDNIKSWLIENKAIGAEINDITILAFLRGCKFNLDKTKEKIKNYYQMRSEIPEWFANRDPLLPEIQELARIGVFIPLQKLHNNQHVVIIRTAAHDPKKHSQDNVFKTGKMILDVLAHTNERLQIYGIIAIFDMENISLAHAKQLPPTRIKKAVHAWQNYHCRPKQLEFINAPTYINLVLNIFKSFMSDKLKGRVRVHFSGMKSLHEIIPKNILPAEYGGDDGNIDDHIQFWCKNLVEHRNWFIEKERYKSKLL